MAGSYLYLFTKVGLDSFPRCMGVAWHGLAWQGGKAIPQQQMQMQPWEIKKSCTSPGSTVDKQPK